MDFTIKQSPDRAYSEICRWLDTYVARLTGENRFLCTYSMIRHRFPEYNEEVLHKVWDRLRATGRVKLDPLDGEWIVARA